jgi:methionyl-tRNA synthetase
VLLGVGETFDELNGKAERNPLVLPYDVPANEFMNWKPKRYTATALGVYARDFLSRYDPTRCASI